MSQRTKTEQGVNKCQSEIAKLRELKRMSMAEEMDGKDSFIDKIFRHIKAYKDGLSAHILKNRLKHDNDVNEKLYDVV